MCTRRQTLMFIWTFVKKNRGMHIRNTMTTKWNKLNVICACFLWSILPSLWWSIFETYMECNIGGRYIKCSENELLSLLRHTCQCTWDLYTLFQYHEAKVLPLFPLFFKAKVITNELTIKKCLSGNFLYSRGRRHFYLTTGGEYRNGKCW